MSNPENGPQMDPEEVHHAMMESDHEGSEQEENSSHEKAENNLSDEDVEGINNQVAEL
ncbi:MAG TPA: hypothetical protein VHQ41_03565 [Patescibacteria group bacterium]|jgi:hypothetical protein|nr:hypothetical protein [Patescibacteria group bacterium]